MRINYSAYNALLGGAVFLLLSGCMLALVPAMSSTGGQERPIELKSQQLNLAIKPNIFADYEWAKPDIQSIPISFVGGKAELSFGQTQFQLTLGENKITFSDGINTYVAPKTTSNYDCYYNAHELTINEEDLSYWETAWITDAYSEQVTGYRTEAIRRTRKVDGKDRDTIEHVQVAYQTTETRQRQVPIQRWVVRKKYVYHIPAYPVYSLRINDFQLLVYEIERNGYTYYYLQNISYLQAVDKNQVNYILIDADANGSYLDSEDKVFFNTISPGEKNYQKRPVKPWQGNKWYSLGYLNEQMFLTLHLDLDYRQLRFDFANNEFLKSGSQGKIVVSNLASNCELTLDGRKRSPSIRRMKAKLDARLGKQWLEVKRDGYLPLDTVCVLNKQNRVLNIAYVETPPAAELEIQHIYSDDFRVIVKNSQGYERTYFNQPRVYVPLGKSTVIIDDGGMITAKEVVAQKWRSLKLNYSDELRARLHNPAGAGNNGR